MNHTTVKPVRLRYRNDLLDCEGSRVVCYRGLHECGWRGPRRTSVKVAREDARIHAASCTG